MGYFFSLIYIQLFFLPIFLIEHDFLNNLTKPKTKKNIIYTYLEVNVKLSLANGNNKKLFILLKKKIVGLLIDQNKYIATVDKEQSPTQREISLGPKGETMLFMYLQWLNKYPKSI